MERPPGLRPGERETRNIGTYENPLSLDPQTWTRIKFTEYDDPRSRFQWLFLKEGACTAPRRPVWTSAPPAALKYGPMGIITFERELCNGCGYCSQFCPFGVPQLEVLNALTGEAKSSKCVFCQDRTTNGLKPACVKTCPAGALDWGDRDAMIAKAEARVEELKAERGFPKANVYGKTELGGLGRIYVLTAPAAAYDLPEDPKYPAMSTLGKRSSSRWGRSPLARPSSARLRPSLSPGATLHMEEVE